MHPYKTRFGSFVIRLEELPPYRGTVASDDLEYVSGETPKMALEAGRGEIRRMCEETLRALDDPLPVEWA